MRAAYPAIEDITVPEGRRGVDKTKVAALAESIGKIGLLHPIVVSYFDESTNLVAGRHRLEAARSLGWTHIDAYNATQLDDDERELIEIDENLCRNELSPAEEASALARRKVIYDRLNGTTHGGDRRSEAVRSSAQNEHLKPDRFTKDTADNTGRSEATIKRAVARANAIGPDDIRRVAGTSLDKPGELDALAKADPEVREDLINRAAAGEKVSAKRSAASTAEQIDLQPSEDADASAAKRKAEYAADESPDNIAETNKFCLELGKIMQSFVPRFRAWFEATDVPAEGRDALHHFLMHTADELMLLAQDIDGRGENADAIEEAA